jgi:hypothetical protein
MRRSICYCEPAYALAGEVNTWKFVYTPATNLPKGTKLKFDLQTKGRFIDWDLPEVNLKKEANVIYALMDKNSKPIQAKEIESANSFTPQYEFILPAALPAGKDFTVVMGALKPTKANIRTHGNKAQTNVQRRRPFLLYVDPSGKGRYDEPETFSTDIRGNVLKTIKIVAPSHVVKNKRFDVVVRFEDEHGNLTSNTPEETLIELSHEHLRENLNWKLFVPETGFISLPNLYFNEAGVYTIQLRNSLTKEIFKSGPIRCFADGNHHLYWGMLHGESERYDSTENIESCLRHFRDERAFNFYSTSAFDSAEETPNDVWKQISQSVTDLDEEGRFSTFLGLQWVGDNGSEGIRQLIFSKDNKPLLRKKDVKYSSLKKIYKSFTTKELIAIPSFTMGKGYDFNFKDFDPEYERVVEIYNAWGSSENSKKEKNPFPIESKGKKGVQESLEGSVQKALLQNHRFGFVAGGLDDRGIYSDFYDDGQEQYSPGLTAIVANEHNRDSLFDALYKRNCYATTGERMLMGLFIAGAPMGSEINTSLKRGLLVNRHITGYVAGTTKLQTVELIRNGKVIKTFKPDDYTFELVYDDMDPLDKVVTKSPDKRPPFVFYYLRATQEDGHIAWSSPIWIDFVPAAILPKPKVVPAKPLPKKPIIQEEEDEEDDETDYGNYDDYDDEDEE